MQCIKFLQIYHDERTTEHLVHKMGHLQDSGLFAAKLEYFFKLEFIETWSSQAYWKV